MTRECLGMRVGIDNSQNILFDKPAIAVIRVMRNKRRAEGALENPVQGRTTILELT